LDIKKIKMKMVPVQVGIIGLSKTGWAISAHLPYLLSKSGREKYQIVAICNSSAQSAREAIELYKLPDSTRAYGDPEGLSRWLPAIYLWVRTLKRG
jgi:predicted dehydrogenase